MNEQYTLGPKHVVAGAAIINVVLAGPFALLHNPDAFAILSPKQHELRKCSE